MLAVSAMTALPAFHYSDVGDVGVPISALPNCNTMFACHCVAKTSYSDR
jgi:hypothetical protein